MRVFGNYSGQVPQGLMISKNQASLSCLYTMLKDVNQLDPKSALQQRAHPDGEIALREANR